MSESHQTELDTMQIEVDFLIAALAIFISVIALLSLWTAQIITSDQMMDFIIGVGILTPTGMILKWTWEAKNE